MESATERIKIGGNDRQTAEEPFGTVSMIG